MYILVLLLRVPTRICTRTDSASTDIWNICIRSSGMEIVRVQIWISGNVSMDYPCTSLQVCSKWPLGYPHRALAEGHLCKTNANIGLAHWDQTPDFLTERLAKHAKLFAPALTSVSGSSSVYQGFGDSLKRFTKLSTNIHPNLLKILSGWAKMLIYNFNSEGFGILQILSLRVWKYTKKPPFLWYI